MKHRQIVQLGFIIVVSAVVIAFQNCGGGGGGGSGGTGNALSAETWHFTISGTGGNAQCGGEFSEGYEYDVALSGSLRDAVAQSISDQSSHTVRGTGEFAGQEVVTAQSQYPQICLLEPTNVTHVPASLEAYMTGFSGGSPTVQMFIRADNSATIIGCKALMTSTQVRADAAADKLSLIGTDFSTPGTITGTWQTVGDGGPGNGNNAHGTFTATVVQVSATATPGPNPTATPGPLVVDPSINHRLSVSNLTKSGAIGSVSSSPAGVNCGSACLATYGGFAHNSTVTLTAVHNIDVARVDWGGDCAGTTGDVATLTMTGDKDCTVSYVKIQEPILPIATTQLLLEVAKTGIGVGTITSSPGTINCGSSCSATYLYGNGSVTTTLTVAPAAGSTFVKWMGDCSGTSMTQVVAMTARRKCIAILNSP